MPGGPTQEKTGFPREDQPNDVNKTGRDSGFGPGQPSEGFPDEDSANSEGKTGRDSGFGPTQPGTGTTFADSGPSKEHPSGRLDKIEEI